MKRFRILLAAVVMQMCLGATYAWSVFVLPLKQITAILQGTAQLPFSLFYFAFPATMIVTGTLLPKVAFDPLGSFSPVLWGLGGLMSCGAITLGMGVSLKSRNELNIKLNRNVTHNHAEAN